jgi:hypothetical protein
MFEKLQHQRTSTAQASINRERRWPKQIMHHIRA